VDLNIVSGLLRAIAGVAANPAFGTAQAVVTVANLGAALIEAGEQGIEGLKKLTEQVEGMVTAGRNPTADEFSDLRSRSDAAHAAIQGMKIAEEIPKFDTLKREKLDTLKHEVPAQTTSQLQSAAKTDSSKSTVASPQIAPKPADVPRPVSTPAPRVAVQQTPTPSVTAPKPADGQGIIPSKTGV
jgi:hypothetical protein